MKSILTFILADKLFRMEDIFPEQLKYVQQSNP
jgi:hypothetical protein